MAGESYTEHMEPTYTPEIEEAHHRANIDQARAANGNALADHRFCVLVGTPEWERWALSLPVDRSFQQPIQNPDGTFIPMQGIDY